MTLNAGNWLPSRDGIEYLASRLGSQIRIVGRYFQACLDLNGFKRNYPIWSFISHLLECYWTLSIDGIESFEAQFPCKRQSKQTFCQRILDLLCFSIFSNVAFERARMRASLTRMRLMRTRSTRIASDAHEKSPLFIQIFCFSFFFF